MDRASGAARSPYRALRLATLAAGAVPLLVARPAPLQDWPNHLARVVIEAGLLAGDPFWARFYTLGTFWVPNAALDLGVLGLHAAGLPVQVAGQVFLLATYAVFVAGFLALARALGSDGPEKPALAVLLFHGHALFWGLVNYVLGVGLMLGLLALWLRRGPRGRLLVACCAAPLLFVHLVPAVAFGVVLGCFEAAAILRGRARPWARVSGLVALAAVGLATHLLPGGATSFGAVYAGGGVVGFALWKLRVFATVLAGGGPWQEAATLLAALVAAVVLRRARVASVGAAAALAGLVALVLVAPERLGDGSLLDLRLALLPLVVGAAAVRPPPLARPALVALLVAVGLRTAVLAGAWWSAGRVFARFEAASAVVPPGAVVMMAYGTKLDRLTWWDVWSPPILSLATGVVARGVFFPAVFANPMQQPVARRAAFDALGQPWDLTDAHAVAAASAGLAPLCRSGNYTGVFLTVLHPGPATPALVAPALLAADRRFLLLDACRLPAR